MKNIRNGPFYEDFEAGSRTGRTVTDSGNIWFSLITNNPNQIHFNMDYTRKFYPGEPFGRPAVNGMLTLSVVVSIVAEYTSSKGFMIGLGNARFTHPVFSSDTIYGEVEIVGKRASQSRPGSGVVSMKTRGINQDDATVVTFDRDFMIPYGDSGWDKPGGGM